MAVNQQSQEIAKDSTCAVGMEYFDSGTAIHGLELVKFRHHICQDYTRSTSVSDEKCNCKQSLFKTLFAIKQKYGENI